jgi:signal transduction histidine kinase/ActR/RegA family two-component response regulator
MAKSFFKSLRFQMPFLILLGVVPPTIASILSANSHALEIIRQEQFQHLALKSETVAQSVSRWQEIYTLALENLNRQPEIVSMNPSLQKPVLDRMVVTYKDLYIAHTVNLKGFNVARSDGKPLKSYSDRFWFRNAIAGNEINYQTLVGRISRKPSACITKPIRDEKAKIQGATTICSDLEVLSQQIGIVRFGKTGYAFVVDEVGNVLAHPNPTIASSKTLTNFSDYPPVKNLLQRQNGILNFIDDRGIAWLSSSTKLNNGWGVIILQQEAEALSQATEFQKSEFIIAAIGILGASIIAWLVARHLLKPIQNLTTAASDLADGNLERRVKSDREDELGTLAHSFDRMAQQLKDSFANLAESNENLENRVKQRTVDLEEAIKIAESSNRAKGNFLANMSHELRTPLNSILGYAQVLQRDRNLYDSQIEELKIIQQSGNHLLTLIDDVLDFSKIEAKKMTICPSNLDFLVFLEEIIAAIRLKATQKNLVFEWEKEGELPAVIQVDAKRLRQILLNLLSNAIKFTDRGQIKFTISTIDSVELPPDADTSPSNLAKIRFKINDTGIGIENAEIEKIFQPFEQVGDLDRQISGTGLGLSISQCLSELMGSEIKVSSQLGEGSTFWFEIVVPVVTPISQVSPAEVDCALRCAERNRNIISYKGQKRKLLVVDDRQENCLLLLNILNPLGFEVITAISGDEGLAIARKNKPDLILTDLFMRVKTGFTMVKELRQIPEFQKIPVIATSANNFSSVRYESKQVGCNAFLAKPIEEKILLNLLKNYLKLEWRYDRAFP